MSINFSASKNRTSPIKIVIICIVIFTIYQIWSYINFEASSKGPYVTTLTERIKSEHPKCDKISHIDYSVRYGDVAHYTYIFQLDQSSGCEYKSIQFSGDFSGFTETTVN